MRVVSRGREWRPYGEVVEVDNACRFTSALSAGIKFNSLRRTQIKGLPAREVSRGVTSRAPRGFRRVNTLFWMFFSTWPFGTETQRCIGAERAWCLDYWFDGGCIAPSSPLVTTILSLRTLIFPNDNEFPQQRLVRLHYSRLSEMADR